MTRTGIDLYGIAHVKVDFIPVLKMCVLPILGRFVWTTSFGQCVLPSWSLLLKADSDKVVNGNLHNLLTVQRGSRMPLNVNYDQNLYIKISSDPIDSVYE